MIYTITLSCLYTLKYSVTVYSEKKELNEKLIELVTHLPHAKEGQNFYLDIYADNVLVHEFHSNLLENIKIPENI